jgi:serine/threonine protein kinase
MSPEQTRGESIDASSDVWAFGCVLYEMLTGTPAFAAATVSETFANILTKEPNWRLLPGSIHADVRALLRRCLAKERRERIGDASQLRRTLDGTSRLRDTRWGRPVALVLATLAVVGLVVGV